MKQIITTIIILLFIQHQLSAQNTFAPIGSSWNYIGREDMYNFLAGLDRPDSFWNHHLVSEKDTVVQGISCRKLIATQIKRIDDGIPFEDASRTVFVYDNTDTVFFYAENTQRFEPLYIFNLNEGDTAHIPYFDLPGQAFKYVVDSIRSELYDTSHLRAFYTHLITNPVDSVLYSNNWGFAHRYTDSFIHKGKYTEKIGGYLGFFPTHCPIGATGGIPRHEVPAGILQCYSDNTIHYKADNLPCDYLPSPTGIIEPFASKIDITIFPNPATKYVYIKGADFDAVKEIAVFDLTGRKVTALTLSGKHNNGNYEVDMRGYVPGIYMLRLSGEGFSLARRLNIMP